MLSGQHRVYVDFDDVLCATAMGFLEVLRREFGKTFTFEEIVDFDLGRSFDLDPADLERFFELVHEDETLAGFAPLDGALETLAEWKASGFAIEIVTGRPPDTRAASQGWLEQHRVPYDDLVFVEKYDHASGGTPLPEIVARDYAWVVEDSFATAEHLALGGQRVHLLDRPWNRLTPRANAPMVRCANWHELRETVRG